MKKIAFYYYRFYNGGVEKVLSMLIPMFAEIGYEIVFITVAQPNEMDYSLPFGVRRYSIGTDKDRDYKFRKILEDEAIDVLCYHSASGDTLERDLQYAKEKNIRFVLTSHGMFASYIAYGMNVLKRQLNLFRKVDALIVLSQTEQAFWEMYGIHSVYIPNPIEDIDVDISAMKKKKNRIIWVGRIDKVEKRFQDVFLIAERVVKEKKDVIFEMYGKADCAADYNDFMRMLNNSPVSGNIEYKGYECNISKIYNGAGVHLVTSPCEGFPLNIIESRQYGIPLVTYEMPYLEILKQDECAIQVAYGDYEGMSNAIIRLLNNENLYNECVSSAVCAVKNLKKIDIKNMWMQAVEGEDNQELKQIKVNDYELICKVLTSHSIMACELVEKERKLNSEYKLQIMCLKLQNELQKRDLKIALYPYGKIAREIKSVFVKNGMYPQLIIDNYIKGHDVISLDDFRQLPDKESYMVVVCSNRIDIYDEIRNQLKIVTDEKNIFDIYSIFDDY